MIRMKNVESNFLVLFLYFANPYFQNQFFISGLSGDEIIQNRVLDALYKRILRAHKEKTCFRVIIVIPLLPGYQVELHLNDPSNVFSILDFYFHKLSK